MRTSYIVWGVIVLLLVGGVVFAQNGTLNFWSDTNDAGNNPPPPAINPPPPVSVNPPPPPPVNPPPPPASGAKTVTVQYTDSGFSPASITIKKGDTVKWTNASTKNMWVASAIHPTHDVYPTTGGCLGSTFDECKGDAPGSTYSFRFDAVGTWRYHDHINASRTGTVIVTN